MNKVLPKHARVVIIGGGIHGCSVAYHLAKEGWKDIVLLERKQLTCGTTWHAAGLVGRLQGGHATTAFAQYGSDLFQELEKETGQATGYKCPGSISIATNLERMAELKRQADFALLHNEEASFKSVDEIMDMWPMMNPDQVVGGIWVPGNGYINPIDLTMAMAKGARQNGVQIFEQTLVQRVLEEQGKVIGVETAEGTIKADFVVNCAGMWARELGRQNGVGVALHACEHYYLVTDQIVDLPKDLPVLRSYDDCTYFKEDAGKLLFGFAHHKVKPWGMQGIPEEFCFDSLEFVDDDVMDVLEMALNRVPLLQETGIRTFFNGPESYSFDGRFTLGEAPEVKNYFVLAGVNSTGIQSGAGAGRALAQWIVKGYPPMDLNDMDPARIEDFQARDLYLQERAPETETRTYAMHWPNDQCNTVRNLRKTPFYHLFKQAGACFGEVQGWERPIWFAPQGVEPVTQYSFGRQNWFAYAQAEQQAARQGVGLMDYSMLGKLLVEGMDAEAFMQRVCSRDMALANNQVAYTLMLNARGGIESDATVARFADEQYMLMSSMARTRRDREHLQRHVLAGEDVRLRDVTTAYGVLALMGPDSRELLTRVSDADFGNEAFACQTWQAFYIGHAPVWAQRLSFTGELGWEIFVTPDFAEHVMEQLIQHGDSLNLQMVGGEALNALRIEKGFLHWGHDLAYTEAPHQLGLGFLCNKEQNFVGKEAAQERKDAAQGPYLCHVKLLDEQPLLYHNEPVLLDGKAIGFITSGAFGNAMGAAVGLAFVDIQRGDKLLETASFEVLVEGVAYPAQLSWRPFYDANNSRCKA
ncbi:MAG TPA: FAD-dependent oxidoreductase [Oceanospirillaceae bacterium]|nr:FAD-dependent oxidoreductase [Oceanospirillaceae bacterium]